ncbi:MAG TPA: hypothetical protein EYH55_04640 [Methanothermococcus okinawensis]|uniref:Uncharacterized protein n=1 Tax=Methanothermococcus okinawensis TaxID=155863 RepID=A0A833A1V1_9EURY|nr:hypothetical protein [Methanothermococcus okinawensis]
MRNKLIFLIPVLLLLSFVPSYGYESINIYPKYVYDNTSTILLQYKYMNPYYDTYDFTLHLNSSDIVFKNTTIYIPYIEKNKLLTLNITGYVVTYKQSYLVVIYKRYIVDNSSISGIHLVRIYRAYNQSEEIERNITVEGNESKEVINKTVPENRTPVVSVDKGEEKENISLYNESQVEVTTGKENYILYILLGILTGIIVGIIAIYILSL